MYARDWMKYGTLIYVKCETLVMKEVVKKIINFEEKDIKNGMWPYKGTGE